MATGMVPSHSSRTVNPAGGASQRSQAKDEVIMDCDIKELYYGTLQGGP